MKRQRRYVRVITEAEAGFPHAVAMRAGARKILDEYEDPPGDDTLVPRAWVEEHMAELRQAAEICERPIRYVTPLGDPGSEPCDLCRGHEGDCDSQQLFLRQRDAVKIALES